MSQNQPTDLSHAKEEKKLKRQARRRKRRKFFKRFFLLLLAVAVLMLGWRAFTYDGLPSEIDQEDITIIANAIGDPYYTHRLATGNKKLDAALEAREQSVSNAMASFAELYNDSIPLNDLWEGVEKEASLAANGLSLTPEQNEMIFALRGIADSNTTYLNDLTQASYDVMNTPTSDPLTTSKKNYDMMMNNLLLAERHSEQLYLNIYRQSYLDLIAQEQNITLVWSTLGQLIDEFANYHGQYLISAALMASVDTGDYYIEGYYLEATQDALEKLDPTLKGYVAPYLQALQEGHGKPLNFITTELLPREVDTLSLFPASSVYADGLSDSLDEAKESYDASTDIDESEKKMSDFEARVAIFDMCVPGHGLDLALLYQPPSKPEPKNTEEEDLFGDQMMDLLLNAPINKNIADSAGRDNIEDNIANLETNNSSASGLQNELFPSSNEDRERDPLVDALLEKLNDEKSMAVLLNLIKEKQADSKDSTKNLMADSLDALANIFADPDKNKTSNVRFSTLLSAMTEQLDKYGTDYLSKEQLNYAYDFIQKDLNNLSDADKDRAFLAFQSLNPENLLNDIRKQIAQTLGLEDAINAIVNAILSAFTLGLVDFDIEDAGTIGQIDYDPSDASDLFPDDPTAINGDWSGSSDLDQQISESNMDQLPVGHTTMTSEEPTTITVNKNGNNYNVAVPFNLGNITPMIADGEGLPFDPYELMVTSVDCQINRNKLTGTSSKTYVNAGNTYTLTVVVDATINDDDGLMTGRMTRTLEIRGDKNLLSESTLKFKVNMP